MSATGIRVTPEQLQQISTQLDAGASTIEGTFKITLLLKVRRARRKHDAFMEFI